MRARLFFFFLMMLFVCMPVAAAENPSVGCIDHAQCVLGGIQPWECSMEYVEQVYGTNHKTEYKDGPYGGQWVEYTYNGGRFVVRGFVGKDGSSRVRMVRTTESSMHTPVGVHIGMRLYQAFQLYGPVKPYRFSDGVVGYRYTADVADSVGMTLVVDRNKVIEEIIIWSSE